MIGNMINVGANKETVAEVRMSIMDILNSNSNDQSTIVVALKCLRDICGVGNVNVSNCQFSSTDTKDV
jgi:hypothetical protein